MSYIMKPFLKWAGGKKQLLKEIERFYPFGIDSTIDTYIEPFVGGGAVLFDILNKFNVNTIVINDKNFNVINTYLVIRDYVDDLIDCLSELQNKFISAKIQKDFYTKCRDKFNENNTKSLIPVVDIEQAALMVFLNKTCFNGLYRVNQKGEFNVPMGTYKTIRIFDVKNLKAISRKLQFSVILSDDYSKTLQFAGSNSFMYLDPPYKPITKTSSFTAYTEDSFTDKQQIELAKFVDEVNAKGAKFLLSNSDLKNTDPNNDFFDELYSSYYIERVDAKRSINSKGSSRGKIKELLISNFPPKP